MTTFVTAKPTWWVFLEPAEFSRTSELLRRLWESPGEEHMEIRYRILFNEFCPQDLYERALRLYSSTAHVQAAVAWRSFNPDHLLVLAEGRDPDDPLLRLIRDNPACPGALRQRLEDLAC